MFRAALPALLVLFAAGCTPPPPSSASRASAAAVASCRTTTNHTFDRQNRYLLSERDQSDTPFSTNFNSGNTTRGLTQRLDYDTQLQSCLAASNAPQNGNTAATVSGGLPAAK